MCPPSPRISIPKETKKKTNVLKNKYLDGVEGAKANTSGTSALRIPLANSSNLTGLGIPSSG